MLRSEGHAGPKARSSGHLSMETRPPPSEGKGGEVPLLHRPLSLLEQRGLTGQSESSTSECYGIRKQDSNL